MLKIVADGSRPCKPDESGNLRLKASGIFEGYVEDSDESHGVLRNGWHYSGDLAATRDDGAVIFSGRSDDLIMFNGINIYFREIENMLELHPAVREAAASTIRIAAGAEVPCCAVTLNIALDTSILKEHCKKFLSVSLLNLILVVQEFPRSAAENILKKDGAALASSLAD